VQFFAAAFLIPGTIVLARYPVPNTPREAILDTDITNLATYFGVSQHAMLIRIVEFRYVDSSYYWDIKGLSTNKKSATSSHLDGQSFMAAVIRARLAHCTLR
jgi:Zn-dependent peptidase ImmA (M78 family)